MNEGTASWRRRATTAALITLFLVVLADVLFYRAPIGFTVGLFGIELLLAITLRGGAYLKTTPGRIIAAAVACLSLCCVIDPGFLAITLGILGLIALAMIDRTGWTSRPGRWLARWGWFAVRVWYQLPRDLGVLGRVRRRGTGKTGSPGRTIFIWIVPLALTGVFLVLFSEANPVIEKWIGKVGDAVDSIFTNLADYLAPLRILFWVVVAFAVWALLRVRPRPPCVRPPVAGPAPKNDLDQIVSPGVIVRCLILFNILFLLNNVLDSLYLWGGATLPEGMSYPEYARRGAYPLVATALLAAGFVLLNFPSGAHERKRGWLTRLVYLWIGQNIFLTFSAVYRLSAYIEAFSLTRLRCAAAIWMGLVAFGLVTVILRLVLAKSNQWLVRVNFVAALLVTFVCSFVPFAGIISDYNAHTCTEIRGEGPRIDLRYLEDLAPESIPTLEWLAGNLPPEYADTAADARELAKKLRADLEESLIDWRGWTWRRARIAASGPE